MPSTADGQQAWRDLQVLTEIERDPQTSQRTISQRVGIALGLTDSVFSRVVGGAGGAGRDRAGPAPSGTGRNEVVSYEGRRGG